MWEPRRLTTLWASTTCYRDIFTFHPLDRRLGWLQSWSGHCEVEKDLFAQPEIEPQQSSSSLYRVCCPGSLLVGITLQFSLPLIWFIYARVFLFLSYPCLFSVFTSRDVFRYSVPYLIHFIHFVAEIHCRGSLREVTEFWSAGSSGASWGGSSFFHTHLWLEAGGSPLIQQQRNLYLILDSRFLCLGPCFEAMTDNWSKRITISI
jgi:hypothetical protein